MHQKLALSVERCARFIQAELADLLGEAAHSPVDLSHPQFSAIASGVAKATATVTAAYQEAALGVLLPHIQVDSPTLDAAAADGADRAPGTHSSNTLPTVAVQSSAPKPGGTGSSHQHQLAAALNDMTLGGSALSFARAPSSAAQLLAQCNQDGLDGLMTLPLDGDDASEARLQLPAHSQHQASSGSAVSSNATSNENLAARAAARLDSGTAGSALAAHTVFAGASPSATSSEDRLHKLQPNSAALTGARGGAPGNGSLSQGTGRAGAGVVTRPSPLGSSTDVALSAAGADGGSTGNLSALGGGGGQWESGGLMPLDTYLRQANANTSGDAAGAAPHFMLDAGAVPARGGVHAQSGPLPQLRHSSDAGAPGLVQSQPRPHQSQLLDSVAAMLSASQNTVQAAMAAAAGAGKAAGGGPDAALHPGSGGSSSAQRFAHIQQLLDNGAAGLPSGVAVQRSLSPYDPPSTELLAAAGGQRSAGQGGMVADAGGIARSAPVPRLPAMTALQTQAQAQTGSGGQQLLMTNGPGGGPPQFVTVDAQGNVTTLSSQQTALLQQQLQQQQQQQQQHQQLQALHAQQLALQVDANAWQAAAQQQAAQQQQAQQQAAVQQAQAQAAHQQQQQQQQQVPLEALMQLPPHRSNQQASGAATLQLDPTTNTLYTTASGGGMPGTGGGQQLLSYTNAMGETILIDALGNQYTQDNNFSLYGQQVDQMGGLGLGQVLGGNGHVVNIGHGVHPDSTHSEPLPMLVGITPNVMPQHGGHNMGLNPSSLSSATLTGTPMGAARAGLLPGTILTGAGGLPGRTSFTGLITSPGGVRPGLALNVAAGQAQLILRPQDLPGRFKVLPTLVQQRILALCRSNPVISVRDFDDKVVSKLSLLVDSWGMDQALAMLDHLEHRMRTKQGAMKNGPGYLDVAVCSHLDMLKAQGACPKSMKLEDYAAQVLAPAVYHELCEAVGNNRWLAWEHFDQGIIQLVKKLPVESAVEKLQEITYHSFKNVDNIKGCIMSILNSKIREDRRRL